MANSVILNGEDSERRSYLERKFFANHKENKERALNLKSSNKMNWSKSITSVSFLLAALTISLSVQMVASSGVEFTIISQEAYPSEHSQNLVSWSQQSQQLVSNFDVSNFKSVYEAIGAHPNLREFASLCEADEVKQIISLDKTELTVFAPIDSSLSDLLAKSKSPPSKSSINLIELAKHHIAQTLIAPDENTKYPFQFGTSSNLSPLYLTQSRASQAGQQNVFVNNAKILATYLIPIGANSDRYQTLHVIDAVIEYAYVNKRSQLRLPTGGSSSSGSPATRTTTKRSQFSLDDFAQSGQDTSTAVLEFQERFGDIQSGQANVDLFRARAFKGYAAGQQAQQRLSFTRDDLNLERLVKALRQFPELRGKLYLVNESTSLNTYFLPVGSSELDSLLEGGSGLAFEAFVVPEQVLFTRAMGLGRPVESLLSRESPNQRLSLSLAKTMPPEVDASDPEEFSAASKRLATTPLLLQAKCEPSDRLNPNEPRNFRSGVTNAEILVANIPISNGVLHLIKKPILVTSESNLLDLINDNDNVLSNVVDAVGSRTGSQSGSTRLSKFRELLAREHEIHSTLSTGRSGNKTILAPSDQAFAKLKYSLRALIGGDESLIPRNWDNLYRQQLLERLARRHVILHQTLTSDQIEAAEGRELQAVSENGRQLKFRATGRQGEDNLEVESDGSRANLIQRDLIGGNGVLHIIDEVLGEEQETVHSLLESMVLKLNHSLEDSNTSGNELNQLIQNNLRQASGSSEFNQISGSAANSNQEPGGQLGLNGSPEQAIISKSIGQYLEDIAQSNRRQFQLLATSVNISCQLARRSSLAEGHDDWNNKFKRQDASFTYFVPSDLAWLRLQQQKPELYRPLQHFLESASSVEGSHLEASSQQEDSARLVEGKSSPLRPSQSSQRLLKILERHLATRKITKKELSQMDSVPVVGATLRLVDSASVQQQHLTDSDNQTPASSFAALHSIVTGTNQGAQQPTETASHLRLKSLKLANSFANIVQANEASNGNVFVIDNVLLSPEDSDYILQTQQSPAISSSMSSLLGGHNSALVDFVQALLTPSPFNLSAGSALALCGTLTLAIAVLLILALVLLVRRGRRNKLNRHQQLESGLTSSATSGSASSTKSL